MSLLDITYKEVSLLKVDRINLYKDYLEAASGLTSAYAASNQYDSAIHYGTEVVKYSEKFTFTEGLLNAYKVLYQMYKKQNRLDSSYKYLEKSQQLSEQLYNSSKINEAQNIALGEETKAKELAEQEAIQRRKLLITSICLLLFAIGVYLNGKRKQRERLRKIEEERKILREVFDSLKKEIPHLKLATDQPYRLYDYAIDFIEEPPPLSAKEIEFVLNRLTKKPGITAKLSSIHINYWCGSHTKVTACEYLLNTEGKKRHINKENVLYSGDSPNDEPLFEFFPLSIGVANIKLFWDKLKHHPKYLTLEEGGKGFKEFAEELLT